MISTSDFWHCEELQTGWQRVIHSLEFRRPLSDVADILASDATHYA